ncbi:MAG: 30S ribosomal protein S6 [Planctomycetota bacterium]|nr:30S ribosomal protein S6 [Planctomycetota bacterium]
MDKKTYEAMFLLEGGVTDIQAASAPVAEMLSKVEAETIALKPWDERRLAYDIRGQRRGLYVLAYFKSDPERIVELEHNCKLDERILRLLVLRRETVTDAEIAAETPAARAAARGELGVDAPAEGAAPAEAPVEEYRAIEGAPDALDEDL